MSSPFFFPFTIPNFMEAFILNNDIICNEPIVNKCTLIWGDNLGEDWFHFIYYGLGNNLWACTQ